MIRARVLRHQSDSSVWMSHGLSRFNQTGDETGERVGSAREMKRCETRESEESIGHSNFE